MNDVNVINYSVNKLLYYNFMENFCNFIKMKNGFSVETNILNKQAKNNTINNNSNTYNYNISNEHINVLYYKNIEKYQKKINIITKFYKNENIIIGKDNIKTYVPFFILSSSYKINKIVERRIIINLSLQWNRKNKT
ncbi:hypothetical protein PFNF54_00981 [Plasmodium falciparum NF54]|uniref:Uncharacterized protein n=1 Tax=Plasmodium falciparum (isolate NF54) TaxID=5843 RepID=W7K9G6_PLAFO|nr:hypothetical protein PFNF54_00981 [Plasmodium falciparum NF54]